MFTQITAIRTCELAEAALVWFLPLMQRADMCLQLCMRCRSVAAPVAHVRSLTCMCTLVVVFCLIRRERLVAPYVAARVWTIACVAQQVP